MNVPDVPHPMSPSIYVVIMGSISWGDPQAMIGGDDLPRLIGEAYNLLEKKLPIFPRGLRSFFPMSNSKSCLKQVYMSSLKLRICMHMLIFDFKSGGADKRVDYRGGTINNHQKTKKQQQKRNVKNAKKSKSQKTSSSTNPPGVNRPR